MLNSQEGRLKQSKIELLMNKLILIILGMQTIFCLVTASLSAWYTNDYIKVYHSYTGYTYAWFVTFILIFFTYFVLLNTLIPISLIVSLEFVKFIQILFIQGDVFMYHNEQ